MKKIRKKRVVQLAILFAALRLCTFDEIIRLLGAEIAALDDATAKAHFVRHVTDALGQFVPRAVPKPKRKGFVERKLRTRARPCRATRLRRAARCPFQCRLREFAERLIAEQERCCRSLASKSQIQRRIDRLLLTSIADIDAIVSDEFDLQDPIGFGESELLGVELIFFSASSYASVNPAHLFAVNREGRKLAKTLKSMLAEGVRDRHDVSDIGREASIPDCDQLDLSCWRTPADLELEHQRKTLIDGWLEKPEEREPEPGKITEFCVDPCKLTDKKAMRKRRKTKYLRKNSKDHRVINVDFSKDQRETVSTN